MKTKLFALLAVLTVLAVLVSAFPAANAQASTDREFHYKGMIKSMPSAGLVGDWKIGGRTVHVTANTQFSDGAARVGAKAKVDGYKQADGSVLATSIDVLGRNGSGR